MRLASSASSRRDRVGHEKHAERSRKTRECCAPRPRATISSYTRVNGRCALMPLAVSRFSDLIGCSSSRLTGSLCLRTPPRL